MSSNDVFWFRIAETIYASFAASDFIDFNWQDYVGYDSGVEIKLKARNVSYEMDGKKDFKEYSEIPARFIHSKGDAVALAPGGWRPLAFIPNGAIVLFDKNAFGTIFCRDCDDEVGLCPLTVFVLVFQLLKRNLEALSTMAQGRLVILDLRVRSPSKPSQIAWGAPELVVESLESKRGKKALKLF